MLLNLFAAGRVGQAKGQPRFLSTDSWRKNQAQGKLLWWVVLSNQFSRLVVVCFVIRTSTYRWCSSVGIATELRVGRSGIKSRWGRDFPPVQTGPGAHPASCKMGTGSFPGVKWGRGVLLTTHPLLVPRSWKSRAILLPTLWATLGL